MKHQIIYIIAIITFLAFPTTNLAQEAITSENSTPVENSLLGFATAISDSWAIVSAPQKDSNSKQCSGSVIFYKLTDGKWTIFQEISPVELAEFANFGMSVAISGTTAIISSIGDHESSLFSGAVYVYKFNYLENTWEFSKKLKASDASIGSYFGQSIHIKNNTILIGAYNADGKESKSGATYIFEKKEQEWVETAKIIASNGKSNDFFGYDVEIISESIIAIGAYNADGNNERSGTVYLYKKNEDQWQEDTMLLDSNGQSSDLFGYSLSGTTLNNTEVLFIGAPGTNNNELQTGSVYLYTNSDGLGWKMNYELVESASEHNDHFGISLSFNSKGNLFVGANRAVSNSAKKAGKVFNYENISLDENSLQAGTEFSAVNTTSFDHFGTSISSDNENLLISSPYTTNSEKTNSGTVHFYRYSNVVDEEQNIESIYIVNQNLPNPFSESSVISYTIKKPGRVVINLYDDMGRLISVLKDAHQEFGSYTLPLKGAGLTAGIYIFEFNINGFQTTKKMIVN